MKKKKSDTYFKKSIDLLTGNKEESRLNPKHYIHKIQGNSAFLLQEIPQKIQVRRSFALSYNEFLIR